MTTDVELSSVEKSFEEHVTSMAHLIVTSVTNLTITLSQDVLGVTNLTLAQMLVKFEDRAGTAARDFTSINDGVTIDIKTSARTTESGKLTGVCLHFTIGIGEAKCARESVIEFS